MGAGVRVLIAARGRIASRVLVAGAVLLAGLAALTGCGGSSKSSATQTHTTASSQSASTPSSGGQPASSGGQSSITAGAVRATLHGANHAPTAGANWVYSVRATDAAGKPLSGTVETEFTFSGQVVGHETPATHPLKRGVLTDTLNWPKQAVGQPLDLQTVVHTSQGSVTLDWPVTVRP